MSISELTEKFGNDILEILRILNGYYECPKDKEGKRLGPLVGYAGKYDGIDGKKYQYVGDVYANFAVAEQYPQLMHFFATRLCDKARSVTMVEADIFVGPAMGGISLATMLALVTGKRFAYIEKTITALATETMREQSELALIRHMIHPGEKVVIVEDVLNNFSTTKKTIKVIEDAGGEVIAILGGLNRSLTISKSFKYNDREIPVHALVVKPITEYKQADHEVILDITNGNVVWKPKNEWSKLTEAMEKEKDWAQNT